MHSKFRPGNLFENENVKEWKGDKKLTLVDLWKGARLNRGSE
jgi:hypothetical protein